MGGFSATEILEVILWGVPGNNLANSDFDLLKQIVICSSNLTDYYNF